MEGEGLGFWQRFLGHCVYHDHKLNHQLHNAWGMSAGIPELPNGCVGRGGCGRSEGGVVIMSWKLSSVAGSFEI